MTYNKKGSKRSYLPRFGDGSIYLLTFQILVVVGVAILLVVEMVVVAEMVFPADILVVVLVLKITQPLDTGRGLRRYHPHQR